ncbi:AraC family transcriptional regulator [Streptosporangium sp. NBC_01495]|uniref:AraC family transcriptional regulator n=1 Tax=Streptosporangium sp. NBC_01495 TaxID=2903899 RepID=UPI002E2ED273|nr:AraC family transcriptional regulator [Streptosporangium sp. NBC_01495]
MTGTPSPGAGPRPEASRAGTTGTVGEADAPADDTRGILNFGAARFRYGRHACHPALAPFVEHHWIVRWELDEPYEQRIVSHPSVNLVFHEHGSRVAGVITGDYLEVLTGTGVVVGSRFRPAGFRPFLGAPLSTITDRFTPASRILGPDADAAAPAVLAASSASDEEALRALEGFLLARLPARDPVAERAADLVASVLADPSIIRVGDLAALHGLSVRHLQRLFSDYVGVSPKWVIRRYRIHEAAERAGPATDWSRLATDLGYSDQSHFTRDFTAVIGMPPTAYARRLAG